MSLSTLEVRFRDEFISLGFDRRPAHFLVAVSGGCDSVTLLYLLRFQTPTPGLKLTVAHLDHAMREGSKGDAEWVRGMCVAWGLPLVTSRLSRAPRGEAEARTARYAFLRGAATEYNADHILTAHHADDQAETVLYRALRGTGLRGLAGMDRVAPGGIVRPLLRFWRQEIEEFALQRGLSWREDPTNALLDAARNRIRNELLPLIEREIAPGARRSLVSLAQLARETDQVLEGQADAATGEVAELEGDTILLARSKLLVYDLAIASRIVRNLLRRFGVLPTQAGTRRALKFIKNSPSGRVLELAGDVRLSAEFDTIRITRGGCSDPDLPLPIEAQTLRAGVDGEVLIGGQRYRATAAAVRWDESAISETDGWRTAVPLAAVSFPIVIRGWAAGDRVRTRGGTKTLKKLFLERRVPKSARHRLPVLADSAGRVFWVGGIARPAELLPQSGEDALFLTVSHA